MKMDQAGRNLCDFSESLLSYLEELAIKEKDTHIRNGAGDSLVVAQVALDGLKKAIDDFRYCLDSVKSTAATGQ